jgi:hypothetical protein
VTVFISQFPGATSQGKAGSSTSTSTPAGGYQETERYKHMKQDLHGIVDDLNYLRDFQRRFCVEAADGPGSSNKDNILKKENLRDNIAPGMLPDFCHRFSKNSAAGAGNRQLLTNF